MEDTLSKTSEHVRLCVEQIIVPYDIVELFQQNV